MEAVSDLLKKGTMEKVNPYNIKWAILLCIHSVVKTTRYSFFDDICRIRFFLRIGIDLDRFYIVKNLFPLTEFLILLWISHQWFDVGFSITCITDNMATGVVLRAMTMYVRRLYENAPEKNRKHYFWCSRRFFNR